MNFYEHKKTMQISCGYAKFSASRDGLSPNLAKPFSNMSQTQLTAGSRNYDGRLRWFVCALSTEGGWLAPEDCEGPLLPRRLVGVEEEWLVCRLCLLEAIVSCQGSLVGALLISGYDMCKGS